MTRTGNSSIDAWLIYADLQFHTMQSICVNFVGRMLAAAGCLAAMIPAVLGNPVVGGKLTLGHEVREFIPCGSSASYWLQAEPSLLSLLGSRYDDLSESPYDPVYAELSGTFDSIVPNSGFAADYDGVFELDHIAGVSELLDSSCSGGQRHRRVKQTWVLECPHQPPAVIAAENDGAWLFRPGGTVQLQKAGSDDINVFTASGIEVRIKGESGIIRENDVDGPTCTNNRRAAIWEQSKLNGADFRAVGNEPGWTMEILGQELIVFVADYGEHRVEYPLPTPVQDTTTGRTTWDAGELQLLIDGQQCLDTMSGEQFEAAVTVYWNDRQYRGCGRALH